MRNLPAAALKSNLVTAHHGQATTSSTQIARTFHRRHSNVIRDIENMDCSEGFRRLNFERADYLDEQGKPRPMFRVSKDGFCFLAFGFRGAKAAQFKERYISEFNAMERLLNQRQDPAWIEARAMGKHARRQETDTIRDFIEYAKAQGSRRADRYYLAFSRLVNKALGIEGDGHRRDLIPADTVSNVAVVEVVIAEVLQMGIAAGEHYKVIYQAAKARVFALAELLAPAARLLAA